MSYCKRACSVANLPTDATAEEIKDFFEQAGNIERVLYRTPDSLYVLYQNPSSVGKAITELSGKKLKDETLTLRTVSIEVEDDISTMISDLEVLQLKDKLGGLSKTQFDSLMSHFTPSAGATAAAPSIQTRLPTFSGDDQRGDVTYTQWRYHLKCLMQEPTISRQMIMQAIRLSVRGTAAEVLMYLGETADPASVLGKFDTIFGSALSTDQLMMQLFNAKQKQDESIIAWSCRIQQLFNQVKESSSFGKQAEPMLRSIFYHGLWNKDLINATRHNFESNMSFDNLLSHVRKAEFEFRPSRPESKKVSQHQVAASSLETKVDKVLELVSSLDKRVSKLEAKSDVICPRCRRHGHERKECYATKDIYGQFLN